MDTTLITFHLQTSSSIHYVHLIGSWDNFTRPYRMERDVRRASGQWRGCYAFEGIICDGDGSRPKRSGGLKMGQTYYYYYELDDGTEIHDPSLPFTTSCPYLPGQPVNLLWVPVEVREPRDRSGSMSSMKHADVKTMVPADKFMTPRPPPPIPSLSRPKTSPLSFVSKRSARSISPKLEKSPWSPRMLFGLRSPTSSYTRAGEKQGRSSRRDKLAGDEVNGTPLSPVRLLSEERNISLPITCDGSPQSLEKSPSLDISPLRRTVAQESNTQSTTTPSIPEDIEEEAEEDDDDNFAGHLSRMSLFEERIHTPLSPRSLGLSSAATRPPSSRNLSKPLPQLPEGLFLPLMQPYQLTRAAEKTAQLSRSRFSTSTAFTSPTESHFDFSDESEDEDPSADIESADEFAESPAAEAASAGFRGYRLPEAEDAPEHATGKPATPFSTLSRAASRSTFGGPSAFTRAIENDVRSIATLDELPGELGYLGGIIVRK